MRFLTLGFVAALLLPPTPTLEQRVDALERWRDANTTQSKVLGMDYSHKVYVDLKRRVQELEKRVDELEGLCGN